MFLVSKIYAYAQKVPEDFGYRHLIFKYQNDPVDVIVISRKGDERVRKPLLLFCQGNLPQPILKYDEKGLYGTLPFDETRFLDEFHIVMINAPFVPVISNTNKLGTDFMYFKDFEKKIPTKGYTERNYLDYYVFRNNFILKQLFKERWVRTSKLSVVGYSEGSTIATKMAMLNKKITQLIYSGANPYGKIATVMAQRSQSGENKNTTLNYWQKAVENSCDTFSGSGESFKAMYSFSVPQRDNLLALQIPILVTYTNSDCASAYIDLFRIECIRDQKGNIAFIDYPELQHSFSIADWNGQPACKQENWNTIANDWLDWLSEN